MNRNKNEKKRKLTQVHTPFQMRNNVIKTHTHTDHHHNYNNKVKIMEFNVVPVECLSCEIMYLGYELSRGCLNCNFCKFF